MMRAYRLVLLGSIAATLPLAPAAAQTVPAEPATAEQEAPAAEGSDLGLDEIIVTGTRTGVRKFETSYAITTVDSLAIAQKAPLGIADLIASTPGIYVESSGGEVGNNVYSRGLPADNYRYLPLLEDGLPVWEEGAGAFTNADEFFRVDATVDSLQIVRGGSASITASNAPGGVVNVLTKRPTSTLQGLVKAEVGDWDHYRVDANVSGPLTDRLSFSVGGFYREDNGLRNPGFTGNQGGQLRVGLNYDFADSGSLFVSYRKLDDKNIFYTAIPLASADKGLPGLDAGTGTLVNTDFARITVPDGNGVFGKRVDLTQGIHTDTDTFTAILNKPLGDGWEINNRARYTKGFVDFNGLFSSGIATSQQFLSDGFNRILAARPDTVRAVYRDARTGQTVAASALGNQLTLTQSIFNTVVDVENVVNDLSVTKKLDTGIGRHTLTGGYYFSHFEQTQNWNWNDIVVEAINRPRYFDIVGLNAAGQQTVALTQGGLLNLHSNLQRFDDDVTINAFYLTDAWQVTPKLRIDLGARYHHVAKEGTIAQTARRNLGDASTLADDNVLVFTAGTTPYRFKTGQWAFSVGGNYEFSPRVAAFARYSRSFRVTPEFVQWFGGIPVENRIDLVEGGFKYSTRPFSAFVTLFYNKFPNVAFQTIVAGPNGQAQTVNQNAAAESKGVEVELSLRPVDFFDISASGNYQKINYTSFAGQGATGAFDFSGNQIVRQPQVQFSIRPTLRLLEDRVSVFGEAAYTGKRYVDVANTIVLPSYTEVRAGANWKISDALQAQVVATNLFNEVGLTEGNPRAGSIIGVQETAFQGRPIFGRRVRASLTYSF
ncbi:TonB-dependent siderophore receptor [Sphingomonas sp. Leaf4]|uniref:TonB-dependent siderophore receptor n=1 Tax=Sphingomonas sp. Leaf4 TaxID=2876553 RepID=UPI001E40F367|nr:TonB-dependent receptor [Sphingomonas sp. Leaf4]